MKHIEKQAFSQKMKKRTLSIFVTLAMMVSVMQPIVWVGATVIDGSGNALSGANSNAVNLSNSGAYAVAVALSGTLDVGDTVLLTAVDGSGTILTGSLVSASGGESTGSIALDFAASSLQEGPISYDAIVYSGGIQSQVVASGITLSGVLDVTPPGATLSSTASGTLSGAISVAITTSEATTDLLLADVSVTNGVASGFVANSATSYTMTVTPSGSTGTMTVSLGASVFSDAVGNPSTASNILSYTVNIPVPTDTVAPVVAVTSHMDNDIVTGVPTLTGTVTDTGGVASVLVNGLAATLGSGTWSSPVYDLTGGLNTVDIVATDLAGNTGSASVILDRVPIPLNTNVSLSGSTSAVVTFSTDITAIGVITYGTDISLSGSTTATGSVPSTSHNFTLIGLLPDTIYYFSIQGQGGTPSVIMQLKTPTQIDTSTASGSITATGSIYLSGSTGTGVTFSQSGSLLILSLTSGGASLSVVLNGLTITASGSDWDGVLQAPEVTSLAVTASFPGYSVIGTAYQIGNANTELMFSGQLVTVTVNLGSPLSGQTIKIVRSTNGGTTYLDFGSCVITPVGDCTFTTNQLSLFAFLLPADTTPTAFSFSAVAGAELSTVYISNPVTISGISAQAVVSVVGGEYSINSAAFTSLTGTTNSGDTIVVRLVSSPANSASRSATLTVGGVSATFTVTTKAGTSGGGGGAGPGGPGGTGGGGMSIDACPGGDLSPSQYDGFCIAHNMPIISTGSFSTPPAILRISDLLFRDIRGNWAREYIERISVRSIIDNTVLYHPDANLTRAEFLKIVLNTTGWPVPITGLDIPFSDVSTDSWYARYTSLAISKGMIQRSTRFRPNDSITRAEASKILTVALGVTMSEPTTMTYVDVSRTMTLAKYVELVTSLGIFSGQTRNGLRIFRPNDPITRAEIAKVVVNAFGL